MSSSKLPSQEDLKELISYNPDTGVFIWKSRSIKWFLGGHDPESYMHRWNKRHSGKIAGSINKHGYRRIIINWKSYYAHRVAWKIIYGEDPKYIDHIDGCYSNNKISNLRNVSKSGNQRNQPLRSNNSSGVVGVSWDNGKDKWHAYVFAGKCKRVNLGYYENKEEAIAARKAAELKYGFHPNHGRKKVEG